MTNNDELERQKFSESFEYHMGFKPEEYPAPEVVEICMGIWKDARKAGEQS